MFAFFQRIRSKCGTAILLHIFLQAHLQRISSLLRMLAALQITVGKNPRSPLRIPVPYPLTNLLTTSQGRETYTESVSDVLRRYGSSKFEVQLINESSSLGEGTDPEYATWCIELTPVHRSNNRTALIVST